LGLSVWPANALLGVGGEKRGRPSSAEDNEMEQEKEDMKEEKEKEKKKKEKDGALYIGIYKCMCTSM